MLFACVASLVVWFASASEQFEACAEGTGLVQVTQTLSKVGPARESASCEAFCSQNPASWESKCKWAGCSECSECATTTPASEALDKEPTFFGCFPSQSGMSSGREESSETGIQQCFSGCARKGSMYAGLSCYNEEKVKCYCLSYEAGLSPIIPMSAGGNCYEENTKCSGSTSHVAGYEVGSDETVAMYGLITAHQYVVDAPYESVATLPTQGGAEPWREIDANCPTPEGESFSTLLSGSSLLGLDKVTAQTSAVVVPAGSTYVVDQSAIVDGTVTVEAGATLAFVDAPDITLSVRKLYVYGTLQLGTEGCPLQSSGVTITLAGSKAGKVLYGPDRTDDKGIIVSEGAVLDMHGKPYTPTWSRLSATVESGSSTLKLQDVVNWEVNQQVVIVTTRHGDMDDHENEIRTITAVSGAEVTLDSPLEHTHFGGTEYQGEVGLLSRSLTVQGDEESMSESFGGHTLCKKGATCRISYVLGNRMGQLNVMGRYPFHFHMMGDVQQKSYFRGLAVNHSFFRAFTVHGTSNATLSSCVAYDVMGSAVYLEDGIEMDNLFEFNLIARVQAIKPLDDPNGGYEAIEDAADADDQWVESVPDRIVPTDLTPACFYVLNQRNRWVGNVASGGFAGFIFPATVRVLGASYATNSDFSPVVQDIIEFDGNIAHSGGQYWKYGAGMYVGGILINPDSSNTTHYAYNFAKFPRQSRTNTFDADIYRGKLHISNGKFWGCKSGLLAWGAALDSRPLTTVDTTEFHDNMMGIQFFAHNWISNSIFTAQTDNVNVWKGWYTPHTAFKTYDQFMQTLFVNISVRGYKGPGDVGFLMLVVTDLSRQEGFTGFAGILPSDTDEDHLIQIQRGGFCDDVASGSQATGSGSSTSFMNMQDMDGSFTGFEGGGILGAADCPTYDSEVYRTQNWWWLDDSCQVRYTNLNNGITSSDEIGSGLVSCPRTSPNAWATASRTVVSIFVKPYMQGVIYHWGHSDRHAELLYSATDSTDYGIAGPCCDIGWYMHLDEGNPAEMTIEMTQMVSEGGLYFATRYPDGAALTVDRCRGLRSELACEAAQMAADKHEFLNDLTGAKYYIDDDGTLFLRMVDNTNKWFEHGDVHIVQNMVDDQPHYLIKTDKIGQTEMKLPPADWMAA
eukprot:TRINITY_DN17144_c0_g1_i1.p1 TRINITY_DN17144_c0_g1~~TRINITY_DN17144_c0_g1_i1.p1  ORF type:complete len:1133 (+),score=151.47 TRINITY_DN17144_c0_g1_i1:39-3437(+)